MSTPTFNPYSPIGEQLSKGLDFIAQKLKADSTIDEFAQAIYDYIQPLYYPTANKQVEIEIKSVVYNIINAYNNKALGTTIPYNEQQMNFIFMMLGEITNDRIPINAIKMWLLDIENNISKSGLNLEEQTPLLLSIEAGKSIYDYWVSKTETPGDWSNFFQTPKALNYINIPFWLTACINGTLIGANTSQNGLVAPSTDITSTNIISSLIGALSIGAGKVVFKWVPEIQPLELTLSDNGMLSGGFSEAINVGWGNAKRANNKCEYNERCNNVECTNICTNTGTCSGSK